MTKKTGSKCLNCAFWVRLPSDKYVGWCQYHRQWRLQLEHCEHYQVGENRRQCHIDSGHEKKSKEQWIQLSW